MRKQSRSVAIGICLLEQLCFTVLRVPSFGILGNFRFSIIPSSDFGGFSVIPSFRISWNFPSFRHSAVPRFHLLGFGVIFRHSAIPRYHLLAFGVIFRRSVIPPFRRSAVPSFRLGSP